MAGMEGLGRTHNVISVASGKPFSMEQCSAVSLVVTSTGASSIAVVASKTAGGATTAFTLANGFGQTPRWYLSTATDGSTGWTKQPSVWTTNSLALAGTTGQMSVVDIFTSQIADTFKYLTVTVTNGSLVVIAHDLVVQRTPGNLVALGV